MSAYTTHTHMVHPPPVILPHSFALRCPVSLKIRRLFYFFVVKNSVIVSFGARGKEQVRYPWDVVPRVESLSPEG